MYYKYLPPGNKTKEAPSEEDPDEMDELYQEATMSIEELIMRYGKRNRESTEDNEGNSKGSSTEFLSKVCLKARKSKRSIESSAEKTEKNYEKAEETNNSSEVDNASVDDKTITEKESPVRSEPDGDKQSMETSPAKSENPTSEVAKESNGKLQNGSDNHESDHSKPNDVPVSVKGKGVGKGLSNSIRKMVEKTPEELEIERREAERLAKRQERKKSLRSKSADELYK